MKKSISIMLAMAVIVASFPFMVSASSLEVAGKDVGNYKVDDRFSILSGKSSR